jgi:Resolvase, N terminal domain
MTDYHTEQELFLHHSKIARPMTGLGQNPKLPRRNIDGRFTSISGHNAFYLRCRRARFCLLKRIGDGDVLMVTRLDRLARSTRDLLNILDTIAK